MTGVSVDATSGAGPRVISRGDFEPALLVAELCRETNRVRAANGVPPLDRLPKLDEVADIQATYTSLILQAEHFNPATGERTVADRVANAGLDALFTAENAIMVPLQRPSADAKTSRGYTYAEMAAFLMGSWMESPGHRANILDPRYTRLGCAAELSHGIQGEQRLFATQVFFRPLRD